MFNMIIILLKLSLIVLYVMAEDLIEEHQHSDIPPENENSFLSAESVDLSGTNNIEFALRRMENIALAAEKSRREGILPAEHSEDLYDKMVETLEDITEQLKKTQNTYRFLNSKGVDRIITPIIGINHKPLKEKLLILIKTLFHVAPTTTNVLIPISVVDKLLDIFEHDDDLALKAHALDIMYVWLPDNPKIQARVMKLKGLEPFYNQVSKLDITVIHTLLDLFNKIIEEHVKARDNTSQRNRDDFENMKLYQMIGLVERMSTPQVCNGLLNILDTLLLYTNENKKLPSSIFHLLKNIKPFCLKIYTGKGQAVKIFDELKSYVTDPNKINLIYNVGINLTDIEVVLDDFVKNVKGITREEF